MDSSSPHSNLQPLLDDEESSAPATTGGNEYAPPGTQRQEQSPPLGGSEGVAESSNDLNLPITDADGAILNPYGVDDPDLPQLTPLVSCCSCVKHACSMGKWLLLVVISNVVGMTLFIAGWDGGFPFDSWEGGLLALILLASSVWCYMAAKVVERDVERYDQMAQYEQGSLTEHQETHPGSSDPPFVPHYDDATYGQVSRKLDKLLSTKNASPTPQRQQQQPESPPDGTSSLVNFGYAMWSLFLGFGILIGTGTLLGMLYIKSCEQDVHSQCVQRHVLGISIFVAVVTLVASSVWLIVREGVPSGAVPFVYAIVMIIYRIAIRLQQGHRPGYGDLYLLQIMCVGSLMLHVVICCCDGRTRCLPTWIGRDMYVCGIYAWLTAFILFDFVSDDGIVGLLTLPAYVVTGLILDHPTVKFIGWLAISAGVILIILWPFFGFRLGFLLAGFLCIILGAGLISIQNCISNNRVYVWMFCRVIFRGCNSMLYRITSAASRNSESGGHPPMPVSV